MIDKIIKMTVEQQQGKSRIILLVEKPMRRITKKSWEQFSKEMQEAKETVEQLSKLYVIIQEKVRASIKRSLTDPEGDFPSEASEHLVFIRSVLEKIKDVSNDEYLVKVEEDMLRRYEASLLTLIGQLQLMLKVHESKIDLNYQKLKGIRPVGRHEHDLQDEIGKSARRMVRSKSGKRKVHGRQEQQGQVIHGQADSHESPSNTFGLSLEGTTHKGRAFEEQRFVEQRFVELFNQKKQTLEDTINRNMVQLSAKGDVSFAKKYESRNLQRYMEQRKELAELLLSQEVYAEVVRNRESDQQADSLGDASPQNHKSLKLEQVSQKLFPEFNIKTKFMKETVKGNVTRIIADIKKELIEQYFELNVTTLQQSNSIAKKVFDHSKTLTKSSASRGSLDKFILKQSKGKRFPVKDRSQSHRIQQSHLKSHNILRTTQRSNSQSSLIQEKSRTSRLEVSKGKSTKINGGDSTLVNMKTKRFRLSEQNEENMYVTDYWNKKRQTKFQDQVISRILGSKLANQQQP